MKIDVHKFGIVLMNIEIENPTRNFLKYIK